MTNDVKPYFDVPLPGRDGGANAGRSQLEVQGIASIDFGVH